MITLFLRGLLLHTCISVCEAYLVFVSKSSHIQSISFFKDGAELPKYLTEYDFSDILTSPSQALGEGKLKINTRGAFFDTIVIEKKIPENGSVNRGHDANSTSYLSVIEMYDPEKLIWTGCFTSSTDRITETFDVQEFVRRPPLDSVTVIDSFPYNGDFIAFFHVQYLFDYCGKYVHSYRSKETTSVFLTTRKCSSLFTLHVKDYICGTGNI